MRLGLFALCLAAILVAQSGLGSAASAVKTRGAAAFVPLVAGRGQQCEGVMCQLGCCPYEDYVCCKMPGNYI